MNMMTGQHARLYTEAGADAGTVHAIMNWNYDEEIDGAGRWGMTVRATPENAAILHEGYRCYVYGTISGEEQELSLGYISGITPIINLEATTFQIEGEDRIGELRRRVVPSLEVKELAWQELTTLGAVRSIRNTYGTTSDDKLSNTTDGTASTHDATEISNVSTNFWRYLYIGFDSRFDAIRFGLTTINSAASANAMQGQYYSYSAGWIGVTLVDGTASGGITMKTNGDVTFTRPSDWERCTPTSSAGSWFWIRLYANNAQTVDVEIDSITVYADRPTNNALNLIMAYAPTGWQTSGYGTSAGSAYFALNGESVLQALDTLRGQIGGHYRANLTAGTMVLEWYDTFTDSGIEAGGDLPDATHVRVTNITPSTDLAGLVTRIYPTDGDGNGLAETTREATGDYALDAAANYIANTASETAYGRHERAVRFSDISQQQTDSLTQHPQLAANALYDRALNWLKQQDTLAEFYEIEATGFTSRIRPGYTIGAKASATVSGGTVVAVDKTVNITGVSSYWDDAGWLASSLEVTTIERQPLNDADILAAGISGGVSTGGGAGGVSQVINNYGGITGVAAEEGEAPVWTSGAWVGTNVLTPAEHTAIGTASPHHAAVTLKAGHDAALTMIGQEIDLADVLTPTEHTAIGNSAPHHAAVTAGTGIGLSGQQVSIDLTAGLTWTGAQVFQGANTYRHLTPETTDTYDLGSATKLWRAGYLSNIYSTIFAESTIQLIGGAFMVTKSTGKLPAVAAADATIDFGKAMTPNDHLLVKSFDAGGVAKTEYIKVGAVTTGTTYNVTRDEAAAHATDPAWPDGTPYAILGNTGNGFIQMDAVTAPRIDVYTQGADYNSQTLTTRIGDITGLTGVTGTKFGIWTDTGVFGGSLRASSIDGDLALGAAGKITVDTDALVIDANGIALDIGSAFEAKSAINFYGDSTLKAKIYAYTWGSGEVNHGIEISSDEIAAEGSAVNLLATSPLTYPATVMLRSASGTRLEYLSLVSDSDSDSNSRLIVAGPVGVMLEINAVSGNVTISGNLTMAAGKILASDHIAEVTGSHGVVIDHNLTTTGNLYRKVVNNITASTTRTQAGATALTGDINNVSVTANANDCVKLMNNVVGLVIYIRNSGAQNLAVWPASGDAIGGAGVNNVSTLVIPTTKTHQFMSMDGTYWFQTALD